MRVQNDDKCESNVLDILPCLHGKQRRDAGIFPVLDDISIGFHRQTYTQYRSEYRMKL